MSTQQVMVTLRQAQTYIHQPTGLRFDHGEAKIVSAEVAEHLFNHATRSVKMKSGGQVTRTDIRLFEFAPVDSDEDVADAEEAENDDPAETLATVLAGAAPVKADAVTQTPAAKGAAPGGDGQARSRARGAKGGQANT